MAQALNEFFREKKARADAENLQIDWETRKKEWIESILALFGMIESFLDEPIRQGTVVVDRREKRIAESHLGIYLAPELVLSLGDEEIIFSPKGRQVVGGQGRVDVRGESGEGTLILQPGSRWSVVASRYPQLKLVELTEETLAELLRAVSRN